MFALSTSKLYHLSYIFFRWREVFFFAAPAKFLITPTIPTASHLRCLRHTARVAGDGRQCLHDRDSIYRSCSPLCACSGPPDTSPHRNPSQAAAPHGERQCSDQQVSNPRPLEETTRARNQRLGDPSPLPRNASRQKHDAPRRHSSQTPGRCPRCLLQSIASSEQWALQHLSAFAPLQV